MAQIHHTINPYTGQKLQSYQLLETTELQQKLDQSATAYQEWRDSDFSTRQACSLDFAKRLAEEKTSIARLITQEMGKPISQSIAEIEKCIWLCEYYAAISESELQHQLQKSDAELSYLRFDPIGTVFGIMPWNFPFWQVLRYAIPNLFVGNCVLLKHAPNTFGCGELLAKLFSQTFPANCFQHLLIDTSLVEQVIAHPTVQGVTLTGSDKAGSAVAALAGKYIKKSVLELGGSDPFIILSDAPLEKALSCGSQSRMINSGQTCISAKRFLVPAPLVQKAAKLLYENMKAYQFGDPEDPKSTMGVMARKDLADTLMAQIKLASAHKDTTLLGGERADNYIAPTVIITSKDNPTLQEEFFGPVALVIPYENDKELIEIANDSPYGLGASIWTCLNEKAEYLAQKIDAGCIAINDMVKSDPRLPFGGTKRSGYGRELSGFALKEFVNIKTVYLNTNRET